MTTPISTPGPAPTFGRPAATRRSARLATDYHRGGRRDERFLWRNTPPRSPRCFWAMAGGRGRPSTGWRDA